MEAPFAFCPANNNCTFPQYNCNWHPCRGADSWHTSTSSPDCPGKPTFDVLEDTKSRSSSSDLGAPSSSGFSGSSASSAIQWGPFVWPVEPQSRSATQISCGAQKPWPPASGRIEPPSPKEQLTARQLAKCGRREGWQRRSWDSACEDLEQDGFRRGGDEEGGRRAVKRDGCRRVVTWGPTAIMEDRATLQMDPPEMPDWRQDVAALADWAREVDSRPSPSMLPEAPCSSSPSQRSPRSARQRYASASDACSTPFKPGRAERQRSTSHADARCPLPASAPGHGGAPGNGKCAFCNDVLDMNRALYKTDCGVLCHLQCVRVARNQSPVSCRFCGQQDQWLLASPHRQQNPRGVSGG